jgi:hypothetical protein
MFDGPLFKDDPSRPVAMAARHRAVERELACAKERVAEIRAEICRLNGVPRTFMNSGAIDEQLQILDREQREILDRAGTARRQLVDLRAKHAKATRATLAPAIADSARLGRDAATVLLRALAELDAINRKLETAYAELIFIPRLDLAALAARLAHLAAG